MEMIRNCTDTVGFSVKELATMRLIQQESGQAMVEYVIISVAILAGVLTFNELVIPRIAFLYEFIANIVSLPFP